MLPYFQAILGDMVSLAVAAAVIAGINKVFQMATTLTQIKDLLTDIKRNTTDFTPPSAVSQPHSPEALVRAIHADPGAMQAAFSDTERV